MNVRVGGRLLLVVVAVIAVLCVGTGSALADVIDPGFEGTAGPTGTVNLPTAPTASSNTGSAAAGGSPMTTPTSTPPPVNPLPPAPPNKTKPKFTGVRCASKAGTRTCTSYRAGVRYRSCATHKHTRICTLYRRGVRYRVCVNRRRHRTVCHKVTGRRKAAFVEARARPVVPLATPAGTRAQASSLALPAVRATTADAVAYGIRDPLPQVGKLFRYDAHGLSGHCTATLVSNGYIITAGHCLYQNAFTAGETLYPNYTGYLTNYENLYFVPDESPNGNGTNDWADSGQPYGYYQLVKSFVPQCWEAPPNGTNDGACDYGLAEVAPDSTGVYPGQRVGAYPLLWDYQPAAGAETYMMGYPEQGLTDPTTGACTVGFCLASNGFGDNPYFCEDNFSGQYTHQVIDSHGNNLAGTGAYHTVPSCPMTGGASGGPDFVYYNSNWYVNGVNNTGSQSQTTGYGTAMDFNWWGPGFGQFFCGVLPNQCSG